MAVFPYVIVNIAIRCENLSMKKLPDLDQITAFIAVADELSFKRAAERLSIDASALSRRIKDLEARLGFILLHRTTQTVRLTDAGRQFYDGNQEIVSAIRETIASAARISKGSVGHLRIAYMTFAGLDILPAAMALYRERHSEISVSISYLPTQEQKLALARGEVDVGLMLGPFHHSEYQTQCLAKDSLYVAMPSNHRLAQQKSVSVQELTGEPLVLGTDRHWDFYRSLIEQAFSHHGAELRIDCEASNMLGMLGLVKKGQGITIVPKAMLDYCPRGVKMLPLSGCDDVVETIAVWRMPSQSKVTDFVEVLSSI
jgi:DNA-binding transcriptional LysR family regulator